MSKKILDDTGVSDLVNSIATNIANKYATKAIATQSANGLMSAADKAKLDNIIEVNNITIDTALSSTSTNPVQNKVVNSALAGKAASSHTHTVSQISNFPSSLPANGGTAHEVLSPTSKAHLYEDGEGGNLNLCAPDGIHFMEMDLYNNEGFRMYFGDRTKNELYFPVSYNFNTGKFNINGDADTVDGIHASDFAYMTDIVRGLRCGYASASTGTIMTYGDRIVVKTSNKLSYFGWTINSDGWFAPIIVSRSASGTNYTMWDQNCGYDIVMENERATFEYKNRTYYACWSSPGSYQSPAVTGGLHLTVTNNDYIAACKTLIDICESTTADEIVSNPNLLINPDFKINQRGGSNYSTDWVYTVDRWVSFGAVVSPNSSGGINISKRDDADYFGFIQRTEILHSDCNGKSITISAKIDGEVLSGTIIREDAEQAFFHTGHSSDRFIISSYSNNDNKYILIQFYGSKTYNIEWVKLEYGSVATPFIPPDPTLELIKCQRFYYKARNITAGFLTGYCIDPGTAEVSFPLFMRTGPTVDYNGLVVMCKDRAKSNDTGSRGYNITSARGYRCNFGINLEFEVNTSSALMSAGCAVTLQATTPGEYGGYFALDAEIY